MKEIKQLKDKNQETVIRYIKTGVSGWVTG
jgi:hypothetical protein